MQGPRATWNRWARRLGARRRRRQIGFWYHPAYAAPGLAAASRVVHVEAERGEQVLGQLLQEKLIEPSDVRTAPSASMQQLRSFHSQAWLERATRPEDLGRVFGLEPSEVATEVLLEAARRGVGGTVAAAHAAASGKVQISFNLGGGFHHAEPELGSGFCVFNDVGVAISELRRAGYDRPIAIVDLDFHQGNGNTAAFADDPSVLVYSIHGAVWSHVEASGGREIHLAGAVNDRRYLDALHGSLLPELRAHAPGLVFYIAGADVLGGDRLGTFDLTLAGCFQRDQHVLETAAAVGAPVVITFGGGYGRLAWRSHFQLARAALSGVWIFDEAEPPTLRARYARVFASLDPSALQGRGKVDDLDFGFTEEDILGAMGRHPASERFLDYYSRSGLELAFETYGLMDKVRARGFERLRMAGDPSDPSRQILEVYGTKGGREHRLLEFIFRRRYIPDPRGLGARLEVLFIEWLLLQDPTVGFGLDRPPLPGQEHPGLGIAREMQEMLVQACRRLNLAALMDCPSHYHNALYCEAEWRFVDPRVEGRFRAIRAVLNQTELYEATWAVERAELALADGTRLPWAPGEHAIAVGAEMQAWLSSESYRNAARAEKARLLAAGLHLMKS